MRITFANHLRVASFHLMGTALMLIILWYLSFEPTMVGIFTCFWVLYTLPVLYLHIQYTHRNAGEEIIVNANELIVRKNNEEYRYSSNELSKITVYRSASLDKGGIQFTGLESYYFARIITNSGVEVIITCLMGPKIHEEVRKLSGVPYERKRGLCTLGRKF
ncbi:MAG: hypothetical protein V4613_07135 [Bacteroidota bacterium]